MIAPIRGDQILLAINPLVPYLNLAEAEVAKHYNFVKSVDVEAMESYRK